MPQQLSRSQRGTRSHRYDIDGSSALSETRLPGAGSNGENDSCIIGLHYIHGKMGLDDVDSGVEGGVEQKAPPRFTKDVRPAGGSPGLSLQHDAVMCDGTWLLYMFSAYLACSFPYLRTFDPSPIAFAQTPEHDVAYQHYT